MEFLRIFKVAQKYGQTPCTIVQGCWQKWQGENSPFLLHFLIHIHVLMLYRKFELIRIKIGVLRIFKVAQKSGQTPCTYRVVAKFHQKWQGENSPFLLHFLIHIHALMLCRKFELILIKIRFFTNFKFLTQKPYATYYKACQLMKHALS